MGRGPLDAELDDHALVDPALTVRRHEDAAARTAVREPSQNVDAEETSIDASSGLRVAGTTTSGSAGPFFRLHAASVRS